VVAWTFSWDVGNRNAYTVFVEVPYKLLSEGEGLTLKWILWI